MTGSGVLLGMAAAGDEPISGGRHKVFGNHDLAVIPQTSTIASHLPRAVGVAFAIEHARQLGVAEHWPDDAIVICSFGDASINHATARPPSTRLRSLPTAESPSRCSSSARTTGSGSASERPSRWVEQSLAGRPELAYETAEGSEPAATLATATELAGWVREHRFPAVLRLRTVRYLSHAGADLETAYRTAQEIRAD